MAEEFAVDGAFRYGTAVYGEVFLPSSWRVVMNYPRYNLLSHAALSDYEHRQVCRRHLQGYVKSTVQRIAVSHDVITLLYFLKI